MHSIPPDRCLLTAVFDCQLTAITMDAAESRIFVGTIKGLIAQISLYTEVLYLLYSHILILEYYSNLLLLLLLLSPLSEIYTFRRSEPKAKIPSSKDTRTCSRTEWNCRLRYLWCSDNRWRVWTQTWTELSWHPAMKQEPFDFGISTADRLSELYKPKAIHPSPFPLPASFTWSLLSLLIGPVTTLRFILPWKSIEDPDYKALGAVQVLQKQLCRQYDGRVVVQLKKYAVHFIGLSSSRKQKGIQWNNCGLQKSGKPKTIDEIVKSLLDEVINYSRIIFIPFIL